MTISSPLVANDEQRKRGAWSESDVARLISLWRSHEIADIAKKLDRKPNAVSIKASRLGLPARARAQRDAANMRSNPAAKVRPCLRCRTPFFSEGAHNRICENCKGSSVWRSGGGSYVLGSAGE